MKKTLFALLAAFILILLVPGCSRAPDGSVYADPQNWAYCETGSTQKAADVFFICPTVFEGSEECRNMSLEDEQAKASFLGAVNMEKGIYDADGRFFAPYYRQMGLSVYFRPEEERESCLDAAYTDVKAAFIYYMEHYNQGRPLIVAGFSQGADHCIRLLEDCFAEEDTRRLLVACYAIGWRVTQEDLDRYPHLRFASGESDTGVIVSFNSESEEIGDSLMIPAGTKALAINPLTWRQDGAAASKERNLGACFTDYDGKIVSEIPQLTGAYIDQERGALKVTDVTPKEYPASLPGFPEGVYHIYDYQFFYRNLQENVKVRIKAFTGG